MTTLEWIIYGSYGIAFLCILIGAINVLRHLKSKTMKYLTQLDEIDQWLFDSFGIVAGACSSTENLRHNTARTIAEALWPKKDHDACYQCEKNYDNVFFKGEQHAVKMMEKETISGEVVQNYSGEYALYIKAKLPKGTYLKFGDKVPVYIFKKNTL